MSDTDETAPLAVPRDRSVEARRAARQVKAGLDRRIIESLNHGVSVVETAEREDVGRGDPAGQTPLIVEAPPARPEMAPQRLEKIESAPGNGMARKPRTHNIWYTGVRADPAASG
ncbi:MAG TPA: hypothetical protein VGL41_08125 [Roseiarcus sp.]